MLERVSIGSVTRRGAEVVLRRVAELTLHPAALLVPPPSPEPQRPPAPLAPLEVLADGQILVDRERYEQARRARSRRIATVVVTVPEEQIELYVLDRALASQYLTDDQRACLAVEYADRLSARMRKERAAKAAAVRYGRSSSRTAGASKQDARAQSCRRFRVPPKKFRQVRKLRGAHPQLYHQVLRGEAALKAARDAAVREQVKRDEAERTAASPAGEATELRFGDSLQILARLPDAHFTALITDPPYGVSFRQEWRGPAEIAVAGDRDVQEALSLFRRVLAAASPKLRRDAFLITFVPAKFEPEFRGVIEASGWTIIGHLVWVKNTRVLFPQLNIASCHERLVLAVRGSAKLRRPISDVLRHGKTHASKHPCEKPVGLLRKLIEATTVAGEAVLDPFAGTGATVVAARQLGRQAVGIESDGRWYRGAVARLQRLAQPEYPRAKRTRQQA